MDNLIGKGLVDDLSNPAFKDLTEAEPEKNSYYVDDAEQLRLRKQAQFSYEWEHDSYMKIIDKLDNPVILDIGCGTCIQLMQHLENYNKPYTYIGIDYMATQLITGKAMFGDKVKLYRVDLEATNMKDCLQKILDENNIKSFDVMNMALVYKHLFNPTFVLQDIREFLSDDGYLFVNDTQENEIAFPDKCGNFKKAKTIADNDEYSGDSKIVRYLQEDLTNSGYSRVTLAAFGISTLGKSREFKENAWDVMFGYNAQDYKMTMEKQKDAHSRENYEWWITNEQAMKEEFCSPNFVFIDSSILYVAQK